MRARLHPIPILSLLITLTACCPSTVPALSPVVEGDDEPREECTACSSDDECDRIVILCCVCGAGNYIAVNKKCKRGADDVLEDLTRCDCPAQDCPPIKEVCQAGVCQVVER